MPFSVSCPDCGYQFRVPDHVAGQRGKCPKCKAMFLAARAGDSATANSAPSTPADTSPSAAVSTSSDETVSARPRTLSIPKPRLLEKLAPSPPPEVAPEAVDVEAETLPEISLKGSRAAPPPAPPAPPRGAPPKSPPPRNAAPAPAPIIESPEFNLNAGPVTISDKEPSSAYLSRKKKKSRLPLVVGIVVVLLLAVAGAGGGIAWKMLQQPVGTTVANSDATPANGEATDEPAAGDGAETATDDDDSSSPVANPPTDEPDDEDENPFEELGELASWETLRKAVVTVTVLDAAGTHSGTGLLLPDGLVATDFALLHEADAAVITLGDGRKFEANGVIKRPRSSLAVLHLAGADSDLPAIELAAATPPPETIVYIGDAQVALGTRLARRVGVSALPVSVRPQLPELMRDNDEIQLIEHSGRKGKLPDGRSHEPPGGAALFNADGKVVGVNLALASDSRKGYAIGVEELASLVEAAGREEFRPLRVDAFASNEPEGPNLLEPQPLDPPAEPPMGESPTQAAVAKLVELSGKLKEKNWMPETADDYVAFAEFASSATTIADLIDKLEPADKEAAQAAFVAALGPLADAAWPSEDQIAKINELAEKGSLAGDSNPGVFVYAQCSMRPENLGNGQLEGVPIFGFQVVRSDEALIIPVAAGGDEITVGSEWIILGQKSGDAELSSADGAKRHASVLHVKYMLKRPTP